MTSGREYRIGRMRKMGLTEAEAAIVDDAAQSAADVALRAGAATLAGTPQKLATVTMAAFLGALGGTITAFRDEMGAQKTEGSIQ